MPVFLSGAKGFSLKGPDSKIPFAYHFGVWKIGSRLHLGWIDARIYPKSWVTLKEAFFKKIPNNATDRSDYAIMNLSKIVLTEWFDKPGRKTFILSAEMRPNCWKRQASRYRYFLGDCVRWAVRHYSHCSHNPWRGSIFILWRTADFLLEWPQFKRFRPEWEFKYASRNKLRW